MIVDQQRSVLNSRFNTALWISGQSFIASGRVPKIKLILAMMG
jgi:hypothetical protein